MIGVGNSSHAPNVYDMLRHQQISASSGGKTQLQQQLTSGRSQNNGDSALGLSCGEMEDNAALQVQSLQYNTQSGLGLPPGGPLQRQLSDGNVNGLGGISSLMLSAGRFSVRRARNPNKHTEPSSAAAAGNYHTMRANGRGNGMEIGRRSASQTTRGRPAGRSVLAPIDPAVVPPRVAHHSRDSRRPSAFQSAAEVQQFTGREKSAWLVGGTDRGFIRVFDPEPGSCRSLVVPCYLGTTAADVCAKLGMPRDALHIDLAGHTIRRMSGNERPLAIVDQYLAAIGMDDAKMRQYSGDLLSLSAAVRFLAGSPNAYKKDIDPLTMSSSFEHDLDGCQSVISGPLSPSITSSTTACGSANETLLSAVCSVRKGKLLQHWTRRGCALAPNARIAIYALDLECGSNRSLSTVGAIPSLLETVPLSRARVEEARVRGRGRCIKISYPSNTRKHHTSTVYLAFEDDAETSLWLGKCLTLLSPPLGWLNDLTRLRSLRCLNLADNRLGRFPKSLLELPALTDLNLSTNGLVEVPAEVNRLKNLRKLILCNNQLTQLPLTLADCSILTHLDTSFNRFNCVPQVLLKMGKVQHWRLAGNLIETFISEEVIKRAGHVTTLDLRRNRIRSDYVLPTTNAFSSLAHLVLNHNMSPLAYLDLSQLCMLQSLEVERTGLLGVMLHGAHLTLVNARYNRLEELHCKNLPKRLKILDIANVFCRLGGLRVLDAHHNRISRLPSRFENCGVEVLLLHHNKLDRLPNEMLASMHRLRVLNVAQNFLAALPQLNAFHDLNKVQVLILAANCLDDNCVPIVTGYRRLKVLDLSYNRLTHLDESCFTRLTTLEQLSIAGNRLTRLPTNLVPTVGNTILLINAHSNCLRSLPSDIAQCSKLATLDLANNCLEAGEYMSAVIERLFSSATSLKHVDLSCNPMLNIDVDWADQPIWVAPRRATRPHFSPHSQYPTNTKSPKPIPLSRSRAVSLVRLNGSGTNSKPHQQHSSASSSGCETADSSNDGNGRNGNGAWQIGFSETSGERNKLCISQVRCADFRLVTCAQPTALAAVIDGNLNDEIPQFIRSKAAQLVAEEAEKQLAPVHEDHAYLKGAVISGHLSLEQRGQKVGASIVLMHIVPLPMQGDKQAQQYRLNLCNVGNCEAVLCRRGRPLVLSRKHTLDSAGDEYERVRAAAAIVTEGNEFPGVTARPHCMHLDLCTGDEFIIVASHGLWQAMGHTEAVRRVRPISNAVLAAKHLQDMAQSYGYSENLSVVVVRLFWQSDNRGGNNDKVDTVPVAQTSAIYQRPLLRQPPARFTMRAKPGRSSGTAKEQAMSVAADLHYYMSAERGSSCAASDDAMSEPRGPVDEQPNYYFEYKKKMKELEKEFPTQEGGLETSDGSECGSEPAISEATEPPPPLPSVSPPPLNTTNAYAITHARPLDTLDMASANGGTFDPHGTMDHVNVLSVDIPPAIGDFDPNKLYEAPKRPMAAVPPLGRPRRRVLDTPISPNSSISTKTDNTAAQALYATISRRKHREELGLEPRQLQESPNSDRSCTRTSRSQSTTLTWQVSVTSPAAGSSVYNTPSTPTSPTSTLTNGGATANEATPTRRRARSSAAAAEASRQRFEAARHILMHKLQLREQHGGGKLG